MGVGETPRAVTRVDVSSSGGGVHCQVPLRMGGIGWSGVGYAGQIHTRALEARLVEKQGYSAILRC